MQSTRPLRASNSVSDGDGPICQAACWKPETQQGTHTCGQVLVEWWLTDKQGRKAHLNYIPLFSGVSQRAVVEKLCQQAQELWEKRGWKI